MIFLDETGKKAIGFDFVKDKLSLNSPFGRNRLKNLKPFVRDEKAKLLSELSNIRLVLDNHKNHRRAFDAMEFSLMKFKDIQNTVKKMDAAVLDEIELFELKYFTIINEEIFEEFQSIRHLGFHGLEPRSMESALDLLDIDGKRIQSFHINSLYSDKLKKIRREKKLLEDEITVCEDETLVEELKARRLEVVIRESDEELVVRTGLTKQLAVFADDFIHNMEAFGNLDLILAKAHLAMAFGAVCPTISETPEVKFKNVYNPQLADILEKRKKKCIPVSMELKSGVTLLTGANMGGKSVALKTVVLNIYLFHLGFYVFAEHADIPIFDFLHLISEDLQSMSKGLSTFGAEIVKLGRILNDCSRGFTFVALDEFARGTNPNEGAIIVRSVAKYLGGLNSVTLMTTHYDNVSEDGLSHYQVVGLSNVNFDELKHKILLKGAQSIELIAELMDYRLIKVNSQTEVPRDALNICRLLGLSPDILNTMEQSYSLCSDKEVYNGKQA